MRKYYALPITLYGFAKETKISETKVGGSSISIITLHRLSKLAKYVLLMLSAIQLGTDLVFTKFQTVANKALLKKH